MATRKRRRSAEVLQKFVRIVSGALDEDENGDTVLRGRIDPVTLEAIRFGGYQREQCRNRDLQAIVRGYGSGDGSVPDVDLSMRGMKTKDDGESWVLLNDVYVVDGQQRLLAAIQYRDAGGSPRIGATVHFGKTEEWERRRFQVLNTRRVRVSPNIIIRNEALAYPAIAVLQSLTESDKTFVLYRRVCWQQYKRRDHLVTAGTLLRVLNLVHSHLVPGERLVLNSLVPNVQKACDLVGRNVFRDNTKEFFQLIEDCWGIRMVTYEGAPQLKGNFLHCLARLLSRHEIFWRGNRLFVESPLVRKLSLFNVQDPTVIQLASSGGQSHKMLYNLLIDHINSGKRTGRLKPRGVSDEAETASG